MISILVVFSIWISGFLIIRQQKKGVIIDLLNEHMEYVSQMYDLEITPNY